LPELGRFHNAGAFAVYADGYVRFIRRTVKEKTPQALITRNGGEKIDEQE
jgi:hypothetical protein